MFAPMEPAYAWCFPSDSCPCSQTTFRLRKEGFYLYLLCSAPQPRMEVYAHCQDSNLSLHLSEQTGFHQSQNYCCPVISQTLSVGICLSCRSTLSTLSFGIEGQSFTTSKQKSLFHWFGYFSQFVEKILCITNFACCVNTIFIKLFPRPPRSCFLSQSQFHS